jgi:hypothetical protein
MGILRDYTVVQKGEVQLQPNPQAKSELTSWDDFRRSVLNIIAELSPCPEPTLFVIAGLRGLQAFGDGTLEDLRKLLGQSVQELQGRGLVEINGEQLVITSAGRLDGQDIVESLTEDDDILELSTVAEGAAEGDNLLLTAELELKPSFPTGKLDEATTSKKRPRTQDQVSGDTESGEWREELQKKWSIAEGKFQK